MRSVFFGLLLAAGMGALWAEGWMGEWQVEFAKQSERFQAEMADEKEEIEQTRLFLGKSEGVLQMEEGALDLIDISLLFSDRDEGGEQITRQVILAKKPGDKDVAMMFFYQPQGDVLTMKIHEGGGPFTVVLSRVRE